MMRWKCLDLVKETLEMFERLSGPDKICDRVPLPKWSRVRILYWRRVNNNNERDSRSARLIFRGVSVRRSFPNNPITAASALALRRSPFS